MADATSKSGQRVFWIKLACIAVALIVTLRIRRVLRSAASDGLPTPHGRLLALSSIVLWAAAITAGRLMAYL